MLYRVEDTFCSQILGLLDYLQNLSIVPSSEGILRDLSLPPDFAVSRHLGDDLSRLNQLTYRVERMPQALQQCLSLGDALSYPLLSGDVAFDMVSSFSEIVVWLLDALVDMRSLQKRYESVFPGSPLHIIQKTLQIVRALSNKKGVGVSLRNKAVTLLVLFCGEMASSPDSSPMLDSTDEETRRTYCVALATVAKACIGDRPLGRLAVSKLVDETALLYPEMPAETDIWVGNYNQSCFAGS